MMYGRQQLLWQKQVTVMESIKLVYCIDEYHTGVAQFWLSVAATQCEGVLLQRLYSLLQQMHRVSLSVYLLVYRIWISFISLNKVKITSFGKCFEQLSLVCRFASVIFSSHFFKLFRPKWQRKMISYDTRLCHLMCWMMAFLAGHICLVPGHLPWARSLQCMHAGRCCCAFGWFSFWKANILQGSVATQFRCGGIFSVGFIANPAECNSERILKIG